MTKRLIGFLRAADLLERRILENHGEISPEIETLLTEAGEGAANKVDGTAYFLDRLADKAAFWETKAREMERYAKACKTAVDRVRQNLKFTMVASGRSEVSGAEFRFCLTPARSSLKIINQDDLHADYIETVVTKVPSKDKIRSDLENGLTVAGAMLEEVVALRRYASKSPVKKKKKESRKTQKAIA